MLGATAACVAAAFGIEVIRKRYRSTPSFPLLLCFLPVSGWRGAVRLCAERSRVQQLSVRQHRGYHTGELTATAVISVLVLTAFVLLYKELFAIALDENAAHRAGCLSARSTAFIRF